MSEASVRVIVKMPQGAPNADRCTDRLTGPEADRYGPGMELFSRTKKVTPPEKVTQPETVTPPEVPNLVSVDPSWAALPTLSHGKSEGQIKLSGPTFYRQNIAAALARYSPLVMAELRVVATGQYAGAVRVFVAGQQVASIPHSMSEEFGRVVLDLEADGQIATMHVELDMQDPYVDVWGYGIPERRHPDEPTLFLQATTSWTEVAPDIAGRLDEALHSKAKKKRMLFPAVIEHDLMKYWVVWQGEVVTALPAGAHRYLGRLEAAGLPLTTWLVVQREEGRLRVKVACPDDS